MMRARAMRTTGEVLAWPLGQYFICRVIDSGKFGTVYHARHEPSGRDVALKLIPLDGVDGDEKVAAERHGALLQQRFGQTHKNLVPEVYEHQTLAAFYAIAMELVHGQPLTELIAAGPLPPERAAAIALAICRFLESAHQFATEIEGVHYELIVHADLKPDHVLLLDNGEIRVLDFGIAKALATRTLVTTNKWGSMQYASPERLQSDGHVNEQADFWSLGIILFEMVAGYRPYRQYEHTPSRLDAAIRRQETPEPLPPGTNPVLAAIIHKLLAPQPERRYSSAKEIGTDLAAFLSGTPVLAATEQARAGQETVRIQPRPPALPAAAVVAGALSPAISPSPLQPAQKTTGTGSAAVLGSAENRTVATNAGIGRTSDGGETTPVPPRHDPVPTERLPVATTSREFGTSGLAPGIPPIPKAIPTQALPAAAVKRKRPSRVRRLVRFAIIFWIIWVLAAEFVGFVRSERSREQVLAMEAAQLAAVRDEYRDIGESSPFGWGRALRLDDALRNRMVELADRTILAYRNETPVVAQVQWEQARDCLDLALEISPASRRIRSRRAYVQGQLLRIAGGDVNETLRLFREAARLDPESPDPYLGLARVFAYATVDIPALTQAIVDAEERGYTASRRERAQLGDAYRVRAERSRAAAARLTGEERVGRLKDAAHDYGECINRFEGLFYFDSERNLRTCRRRLAAVVQQIELATIDEIPVPPPAQFPELLPPAPSLNPPPPPL
jgi:serine/threonine protein kinase